MRLPAIRRAHGYGSGALNGWILPFQSKIEGLVAARRRGLSHACEAAALV